MGTPRTVTISLPPDLARKVNRVARAEGRSRSELLREAFRQYVTRLERWERIFGLGEAVGRARGLTEDSIAQFVKRRRRTRGR